MKFFAVFCFAAAVICQVFALPADIATPVLREIRSYGAAPSYAAPVGPSKSYTYASPAPTIPCGQALVFSCAPSVAQAPCAASAPSYGAPSYGSGY